MLPIRTDAPLRHTPWVNYAIVATNILVFLGQTANEAFFDRLLLTPTQPAVWQYFTSMFMHANFLHIFSNMLFLFIFGNSVCDKMGGRNYLLFYLSGGVMAGVAHVLTSDNPVLGASGAVSAVTGAYVILFPRARVTVLYFFILIGLFEVPSVLFVFAFFLLDVFKQFAPGLFGGGQAVAYMAHIGGTLFGVTTSILLLYFRLLPRDQYDAVALLQRWNRRRQFRDVVASGYNPFGYSAPKSRKPDPRDDRIQELRAAVSEALAHHKPEEASRFYLQLLEIDPLQALSRGAQLDVANQFFADARHADASRAYELYLKHYGKNDLNGHVQFMLGLVYARYLSNPDAARRHLSDALKKLTDPEEIAIARSELTKLGVQVG